MVCAAQML